MSGSIPLHPERALDPHLCFCPRCGGESNSLTIGHLKKAELSNGQTVYANRGRTTSMDREIDQKGLRRTTNWVDVPERERVPGDICDSCVKQMQEFEAEIKAGGIYWQCATCNLTGVIKHTNPVCAAVKEQAGVEMDKPAGLQFETCAEHGGAPGEQETPTP